ncbi:MAG TPA: pyruvate, water dikinase regulatory protein [Acidobacteriota bacterium]|nr:pyruvate, water dikinase regulatory protein [Acidobacteriota bacterium]
MTQKQDHRKTPSIYVVSGGAGASGTQVARTALAQFPGLSIPIFVVPHVQTPEQVTEMVERAAAEESTIVHTLVDAGLRHHLTREARSRNVAAIDLMGPLLSRMTHVTGQEPLGQPGLYREIHQEYFDRIEAIEFTVAHDDGQKPEDLGQAEIIVVGPSRVGKTPLSIYLSVQGWRVANIPLIKEVAPPPELAEAPREKIVGLVVDPSQLVAHRLLRQQRLGMGRESSYTNRLQLHEEIEAARAFYKRNAIRVIDMTDKSIEESAEEVIALVRRRTR